MHYLGSRDSLDNLIIPVVPAADLGEVATLPSEQPQTAAEREVGASMDCKRSVSRTMCDSPE